MKTTDVIIWKYIEVDKPTEYFENAAALMHWQRQSITGMSMGEKLIVVIQPCYISKDEWKQIKAKQQEAS